MKSYKVLLITMIFMCSANWADNIADIKFHNSISLISENQIKQAMDNLRVGMNTLKFQSDPLSVNIYDRLKVALENENDKTKISAYLIVLSAFEIPKINETNYNDRQQVILNMLDQAIELNPRSFDAFNAKGILYLMGNKNDFAITEFLKALNCDKPNIVIYMNLSNAYRQKGDIIKSAEYCIKFNEFLNTINIAQQGDAPEPATNAFPASQQSIPPAR